MADNLSSEYKEWADENQPGQRGRSHGNPVPERRYRAVSEPHKVLNRNPDHLVRKITRRLLCATSAKVGYAGEWNVVYMPSGFFELVAKIDIFAVHKVAFSKSANRRECVTRYKHAGSRNDLNNRRARWLLIEGRDPPMLRVRVALEQELRRKSLIEQGGERLHTACL
jgi:hypothetical protein